MGVLPAWNAPRVAAQGCSPTLAPEYVRINQACGRCSIEQTRSGAPPPLVEVVMDYSPVTREVTYRFTCPRCRHCVLARIGHDQALYLQSIGNLVSEICTNYVKACMTYVKQVDVPDRPAVMVNRHADAEW